jgi:ribosome-binding factor A
VVQKKTFKKDKYEERILAEVNSLLRAKVNDPRLQFVSITKVELNKDFSVAQIYWDTFESSQRGDAKKAIESARGKLRTLLAKSLNVRAVPLLVFNYDAQFESEQVIEQILASEQEKGKKF